MKGGKNKNSVSLSETETPPRSDAVAGDNGVNSEKALEVEEKERDMSAEGTEKEESDVGEDEDVEIQQEELVEVEKPKLAEGFYEIETVRRKRIRKGKIQYLIKWRGWPESANTWEPVENLMTCIDVIDAFEERLQSGKQRSTRKRKRTHGVTHSQIKRKQKQPLQEQQQHSSADATDNMAAVKVRISEEPVPSPPLASLNVIDHVDRNGSCSNNIKVANDNDLMLDSSVKEIEEQNELHLKLSELKGVTATKETSVETGPMATTETSVEAGMIASKETSVIKGVMTTTEISVENGMMPPPKDTSVEKGVMPPPKDTSVEKGVMPPPKDTSVEKGVMPPPKDTSVEKGVMPPPKDTSVEKGVMPPPKDTSLEKEVIPTKEASAEKRVLATKETSVEKGVIPTKEAASVEKGMMPPPKDTSVEKEVMETTETSVEGVIVTGETSVDRSNNGFTSGFSMANVTESLQSGRSKGAKKRKSASVQRFKQQATSGVVKDLQDAEANATTGHLVTFMQEEIHNHELVGNALDSNNDTDAITEIIRALSYLPPNEENGFKEMSVTFLAKRSDGTEIIVDNKFLKTNDPLLLINFYEKHLRHQ